MAGTRKLHWAKCNGDTVTAEGWVRCLDLRRRWDVSSGSSGVGEIVIVEHHFGSVAQWLGGLRCWWTRWRDGGACGGGLGTALGLGLRGHAGGGGGLRLICAGGCTAAAGGAWWGGLRRFHDKFLLGFLLLRGWGLRGLGGWGLGLLRWREG